MLLTPTHQRIRRPVLADLLAGGAVRDVLLVGGAAGLVGLSAQWSFHLPFTPVPVTGQTFGVLLGGMALGWRRAALGMALYLLVGLVGVPWFAGGTSGLSASFGYIIGYVPAGAVAGWLGERGCDRRPVRTMLAMAAGSAVIYACGLPWLAVAVHADLGTTLRLGLYPFLIGDTLKAVLAACVLPGAWRLVGRR